MATAISRQDNATHLRDGESASLAPRAVEFQSAQHHSRRVRLMKIVLPLVAVLIALGFFAYSYVSSPTRIGVDVASSAIADGKLVMASPKLEGMTKDNLPYTMTAARALQNLDTTGVIELEDIDAKLPIDATNTATIEAERGVYDRDQNTLKIDTPITVTTTDGMVAKLNSAFIDIAKGDMTSTEPVDIAVQGARVTADSMTILENGKVLVFEKRVRMQINPEQVKADGETDGAK
ncbi:LPS export ABC transporter periplasmic protein LptC [Mesorhizobium sp. NBSH29]|nr:LPS export ABC transporter periplasmic protein LptC [Mesorhizobium sp. NBSH29]